MANETISQSRMGKTDQYNNCLTEGKAFHWTTCVSTDASVWYFQAAGVSLYWGGTQSKERISSSGLEDSFYGQASQGVGFAFKRVCKAQRGIFESFGNPGTGGFPQESGGWLRGNTRSRNSIILIGWAFGRFLTFISFWFQKVCVPLPKGESL